MQGFVFLELKEFLRAKALGLWSEAAEAAGLGSREYHPAGDYPDEEAVGLLVAAGQLAKIEIPELLAAFGQHLGQRLMHIFRPVIHPSWRTLEFLEHIEQTIHDVVRSRNKAKPPRLRCQRVSANQVTIGYRSERKLCALARGIVMGVAAHYGEAVAITEPRCTLRGDEECFFEVAYAPAEGLVPGAL